MITSTITRNCDQCGTYYVYSDYLAMHKDHRISRVSITISINGSGTNKTYAADLCEKCRKRLLKETDNLFTNDFNLKYKEEAK